MPKVVNWDVDENEILLIDCDISRLPDRPTCPTLVKLFLLVPHLTVIPPTFFDCMPELKVLDLSNTSILSLPSSISSLRRLEEFFLRDCSALIELPTEIGTLTKLKSLDIEGTEVMYIPKEIGNLTHLECLRVSLSPYAGYYIKNNIISEAIIPRMMILKLVKLKELCISVSSEAEWWENEVESVQHELCYLVDLETLKWCFPTNKVLQQFLHLERNHLPIYAHLSNFMLTIGQHAQLISCLPRDLEKKFEKFNKCLKCINGEGSMYDISRIMKSAKALFLYRHWTIAKLSTFNISNLEYCLLVECNEMQTLVEADELTEVGETGEEIVFESLQYLGIHHMKKLQSIWKGPIGKDSLSRLRILALHTCPMLTTIFTPSVVENLLSLIELTVEDCPKVKSLISTESSNFKAGPFFPSLKKIFLLDLPELVNIFNDLITLPELDNMLIYNCPNLRCISTTELSYMKEIKGESEWWKALKCDKSKWNNVFVQLKERRDLVEELVEATNSLQHFHDILKTSHGPECDEKKQSDWIDMRAQVIQADTIIEKPEVAMWQLGLGDGSELYPKRPDKADCIHYLRTGFCGYGARCRFNHRRNRDSVVGPMRADGGYPERLGQPVCQISPSKKRIWVFKHGYTKYIRVPSTSGRNRVSTLHQNRAV